MPPRFLATSATYLLTSLSCLAQIITRIELGQEAVPQRNQLDKKLAPYLTQNATDKLLETIGDVIVQHYQANGQPVVLVSVAAQPTAEGTLMVTISEGHVGTATLTGGRHLQTASWQRAAAAMQGQKLDGIATQSLLDHIQRNPFATNATLSAVPGATATEANLLYNLPDTAAWQASLSYTNDGVQPLGANRWRAGVLWGNAFASGSILAADVTMGEDPKSYLAESLALTIPLPWLHEITLTAAHAATATTLTDQGQTIDVGGDAWLGSLRYTLPCRSSLACQHTIYLGVDYKHFDTDLTFGGLGTFSQPLETSTLVLGASTVYRSGHVTTGAMLEAAWSPGGIFTHDQSDDYQSIVANADSQFLIVRSGLWSRWETSTAWTLQGRVSAQWADGPLLPSEEASITGQSAVRGYEERSILGQQAVWGAAEILTPPIALPFTHQKDLRLISFADAGQAWSSDADEPNALALSVGCGLHAHWKFCQLRCEVAWPLHHEDHHDSDDGPRLHVAASISF